MDMDYEPTEHDCMVMKAGITMAFAERYDMTIPEAASLFKANGIYEYLDRGANVFITRMYSAMANRVAKKLGIPVRMD